MLVAISSCLLGNKIRYDATGKKDDFIVNELGKYCEYVTFCPEHLAFSTPRETIRIIKEDGKLEVQTVFSHTNVTEAINKTSQEELARIKNLPICGIVLKSKSPSCGLGSVKHYEKQMPLGKQDGVFAALCKEHFEHFPIEEEARLQDAWLRENFVMQLFAYDAVMRLQSECTKSAQLVDFHTSYKYLLQSKNEIVYRKLGNIVANHEKIDLKTQIELYVKLFKEAISYKSSAKKTANVLEHIMGFFKEDLSKEEKAHIKSLILDFKNKIIPLITVVSAFELLIQKYNKPFLQVQKFLFPYPKDLALRSDVKATK